MKTIKIAIFALMASTLLLSTSCKKEEPNTNGNGEIRYLDNHDISLKRSNFSSNNAFAVE